MGRGLRRNIPQGRRQSHAVVAGYGAAVEGGLGMVLGSKGSDPLDQLSHVFRAPFRRGHAGFLSEEFPQGVCGLESAKVGY